MPSDHMGLNTVHALDNVINIEIYIYDQLSVISFQLDKITSH